MSLRSKIVSSLVVVSIAAPASAHAVHERRAELRAQRELESLTNAIGPTTFSTDTSGRVTLNGASVRARVSTMDGRVDDVMKAIERDCKSGDEELALGLDRGPGEGQSRPIRLERVVAQQGADGVRASLCVFAASDPGERGGRQPMHRVRYTLAQQSDEDHTAVTTVVQESENALEDLFPAEGDAPGSDLPDVARPDSSRRTLTAAVGDGTYTVRIYESTRPVETAVVRYDEAMTALGYAITGSLPTARMYRRDGKSFVASFIATTAGSNVAIAPFEPSRTPSSHLPSF
jgi:hypothetical protein